MDLEKLKKFALISLVFSIGSSAILNLMYSISLLNTIKIALFLTITFFAFGSVLSILSKTIKKYTKNLK